MTDLPERPDALDRPRVGVDEWVAQAEGRRERAAGLTGIVLRIWELLPPFGRLGLFVVPAGAFRPAPKVDSAVVRLVPLASARPHIADTALFGRVVSAAFGQRRKTLSNALSAICDEGALRLAGINTGARGETLSIAEFVRLANALAARAA